MRNQQLRRTLVALGVLASLLVGAASIRAATQLTSTAAPLQPPVAASSVESELSAAQARSASLQQQLSSLAQQSVQLTDALHQAQDRAHADAATAASLRARLKEAQARLTALSRTTQVQGQVTPATPARPSSAPGPAPASDDGGGDD